MALNKAQDPHVDARAPWENDDLNRRREGEILTRLIQSLSGSYVIALKGGWGTGKSVFLRRLAANLENQGIPVIQIDAWRTDYLEDPLIAFVAAAEQRIAAKRTQSERRREEAKSISRRLANYAGKLSPSLIGGAAEAIAPGSGVVASAVAESAERVGDAVLSAIKEKKDAETRFSELLSTARDYLTSRPRSRPVKPIVVAIDELDRCRPSYAVKVLERIKHFFDVHGIIFVIATDGENLPGAVASVYGQKIDGEVYLRKFFDYEFDLSVPESDSFSKVLADEFDFNQLIGSSPNFSSHEEAAQMLLSPSDRNYVGAVSSFDRGLDAFELLQAFSFFAKKMNLTLRDQSQAFTLINAYLRTIRDDVMIYPSIVSFSYCLRFSNPSVYHKLRSGEINLQGIFRQGAGSPPLVSGSSSWIDSTVFGFDLNFFWEAALNPNQEGYITSLRQNIYQDGSPRRGRVAAIEKLFFRQRADRQNLTQFLPRAFRLADAFS